jgi:hypothetical protein
MKEPFFVIVRHPNREYLVPCMDERGETILQFSTYAEAEDYAKQTSFGSHFGYEVFDFEGSAPIIG